MSDQYTTAFQVAVRRVGREQAAECVISMLAIVAALAAGVSVTLAPDQTAACTLSWDDVSLPLTDLSALIYAPLVKAAVAENDATGPVIEELRSLLGADHPDVKAVEELRR